MPFDHGRGGFPKRPVGPDKDRGRAHELTEAALKGIAFDPESGLFLRREDGTLLDTPVPTVDAAVRIEITGVIARVTVAQTFKNTDKDWVEGVYVFPLSRKGAVDHMLMRIGDRVVEGTIQERQAAKRQYESAKRPGRKAGALISLTVACSSAPHSQLHDCGGKGLGSLVGGGRPSQGE